MTGFSLISIFDSVPTWVMLTPIVACSVIVLAVVVERTLFFQVNRNNYKLLMGRVVRHIVKKEFHDARTICSESRGKISHMIYNIIDRWDSGDDRGQVIRDESETAVLHIERYGNIMSTIATVAPMFGLLGTVTGMMKSFSALSRMGPTAHNLLAAGITESLVSTAFGLIVAIPASMFYNYMVNKSVFYTKEVEFIANTFFELDDKREERP